jgi:hypothetical protein
MNMKQRAADPSMEDSLLALHGSVARLISMIQENAPGMEKEREILDKLPLLDFYNDDLLRNIRKSPRRDTH